MGSPQPNNTKISQYIPPIKQLRRRRTEFVIITITESKWIKNTFKGTVLERK